MGYCPNCGTKLIQKVDGIDGKVDYCIKCEKFIYPTFNSAISTIVIQNNQVLLIKQYGRDRYILVAGYITKGDDCKQTLIREVKEETNLDVVNYLYNDNFYYERSNTLMHNYISYVEGNVVLTNEVDEAKYFTYKEAYQQIAPSSLAKKFLFLAYLKLNLLEEIIEFTENGIELYGPEEKLIVQYNQNLHFIDDNYKFIEKDIQELYKKCYNGEGDIK